MRLLILLGIWGAAGRFSRKGTEIAEMSTGWVQSDGRRGEAFCHLWLPKPAASAPKVVNGGLARPSWPVFSELDFFIKFDFRAIQVRLKIHR